MHARAARCLSTESGALVGRERGVAGHGRDVSSEVAESVLRSLGARTGTQTPGKHHGLTCRVGRLERPVGDSSLRHGAGNRAHRVSAARNPGPHPRHDSVAPTAGPVSRGDHAHAGPEMPIRQESPQQVHGVRARFSSHREAFGNARARMLVCPDLRTSRVTAGSRLTPSRARAPRDARCVATRVSHPKSEVSRTQGREPSGEGAHDIVVAGSSGAAARSAP
jgi:hypothetical protein